MSEVYHEARKEYMRLKEQYLNKELHPNHLEGLRARKKYFKDNSFVIPDPSKDKKSKE